MGIGEGQPLRRKPIHVRRGDLALRIQGMHVPVPEIVGKDHHNVWALPGVRCKDGGRKDQRHGHQQDSKHGVPPDDG